MDKDKQSCCNECGGDNIEWRVWADEFNAVSETSEQNDVWCADCQEHNESMLKKDYEEQQRRDEKNGLYPDKSDIAN